MENRHRELARRPQSVLVATTISAGCRPRYFKSALGHEYGVDHHKFESSSHSISIGDEQRLVEIFTKGAESAPDFWRDYVQRATSAATRLISTARSLSSLAEQPGSRRDLLEGFLGVTEAMQEMAPFVVATPVALDVLTSLVSNRVTEEATASNPDVVVSELLPRVLKPWYEPDPVGDMRNGYRIALAVLRDDEAMELFCETAPKIALRRAQDEFPELHQRVRDHVDEYGWLRAQGYRCQPLSAEDLVYRIQLVLIRWPVDAVREAAQPRSVPVAEEVLGFSPSESLAGSISAVQAMLTARAFRVDVHLQAECLARPLLARVAEALGCTAEQVLFASVDETVAALEDRRELPLREIDLRAGNGFTVERQEEAMVVHSDDTPSAGGGGLGAVTGVLTGMTACRGTAVGRVRIVLDQADLLGLEIGDVLVTAASTIDPTDPTGGTVFPTRSGGPFSHALERVAAVVADEGGLLSHAAIVCRERGLPCVLGAERATTALVDGQVVEVDALRPVGIVVPLGPPW